MALVGIQGYSIPHGSKNGEGGGTTIIYNTGGSVPSDLNIATINASKGNIKLLTGTSMSYNDASIDYLSGEEASLNKISGQDLNYNNGKISNLSSTGINTNTLDTQEMNAIKAWVQSLISERITTDYLTVTKQAHFFELIIDKVKSVGGTLLITATNCIADYVKAKIHNPINDTYTDTTLNDPAATHYDVYWLATGTDGRENNNDWKVNDQAYCQSFNVKAGTSYDKTNKYYWRLVTAKLQDTIMNLSNGETIEQTPMEDPDYNSLYIYLPRLYWNANDYTDDSWEVNVTDAEKVHWEQVTLQSNKFCGIMGTTDTVNGIVLTPAANSDLVNTIPTKLSFYCYKPNTQQRPQTLTPARLNVTVTYINGAIEVFTAPKTPSTQYDITLSVGLPIDNVVITNADEVSWKTVHGIRLSNVSGEYDQTVVTGTASIPSIGDNICQLGYKWTQGDANEKSRGNAIIIAAQKSPDVGCQSSAIGEQLSQIKPPSYAQYEAIGSDADHRFDLAYYRRTYMDGNGSKFYGKFYAMAGGQPQEIGATYVHIAYANSADGQQDFTKTPAVNVSYLYTGICSNTNQSDAGLVYSDYEWSKNSTSITYKLIDNGSQIYTKVYKDSNNNWKKSISASLNFKVLRIEGTNVRYMKVGEMRNWPKKFNTCAWGSPATSHDNYNGFFPYVKIRTVHKENGINVPGYRYYRMALNDNEQHSNENVDAVFNWAPISVVFDYNANEDTTGPNSSKNYYMTINGNDDISIKLIEANLNATAFPIPADYGYYLVNFPNSGAVTNNGKTILDYVDDGISLSINSQATSAISVLEDQISLRSSTTDSISELTVGVQGVQSQVTSGIQGVQSQISQTATGIQAEIWGPQGVQGELQRTGIDITSGEIKLQGNKVTFTDSTGGHQGNVWIDTNYGTLHAIGFQGQQAQISGEITATSGSITGDMEVKNPNGSGTKILISPRMNDTWGANISGYTNNNNNNTKLFSLDFSFINNAYHPNFLLGQSGNGNSYIKLTDESYTQQLMTPGPDPYTAGDQYTFTNAVYSDNTVGIKISKISGQTSDNIIFGSRKTSNGEKIIFKAIDQNGKSMLQDISYQTPTSNYETGLVYRMSLGSLKAIFDGNYSSWLSDASVLIVKHE